MPNLVISLWNDPGRISADRPSSIDACLVTTCTGGRGPAPMAPAFASI